MVTKQTESEFQNDSLWQRWIEATESVLHKTIAWRLKWVLWGMLFAVGRKTVSSWIRAAEVQGEYQGVWQLRYYLPLVFCGLMMMSYFGSVSERLRRFSSSFISVFGTVTPLGYWPRSR